MAKTANIYTRVDPEIKNQAEQILEQLGIPMSNAIGIFLRQVILHNRLPFDTLGFQPTLNRQPHSP